MKVRKYNTLSRIITVNKTSLTNKINTQQIESHYENTPIQI